MQPPQGRNGRGALPESPGVGSVFGPVASARFARPSIARRRMASGSFFLTREVAVVSLAQAIVLGVVQGVTELFPISSLGHSVLLPGLLGWDVSQDANGFLTFLVATHCATALVLLVLYWSDWRRIFVGLARSVRARTGVPDPDARLGWLLIVGTVPAGLVGLATERRIREFFVSPRSAALCLIANGVLLFAAERLRRSAPRAPTVADPDRRIAAALSVWQALRVGLLQIVALVPGFSRTGATIAGGLVVGLSHEDALRYSFLLATPIIGAAALLKLPHLVRVHDSAALAAALVGALAAGVAAYGSVRVLTRYLRTKTLTPFAVYCVVAGLLCLAWLGW
jgi:undecaprenyl-diphosphatase